MENKLVDRSVSQIVEQNENPQIVFVEGPDEEFDEILLFFNFLSKIDKLLFSQVILPIKKFGSSVGTKISEIVEKCTEQGYDSDFEETNKHEKVEEMTRFEEEVQEVEKLETIESCAETLCSEDNTDLLESEEILFRNESECDFEIINKEKID